jgi:hypothetical protein
LPYGFFLPVAQHYTQAKLEHKRKKKNKKRKEKNKKTN